MVTRSAVVQPRSRVLGWRRPLFVAQDRVSQSVARSLSLARTTLLLTYSLISLTSARSIEMLVAYSCSISKSAHELPHTGALNGDSLSPSKFECHVWPPVQTYRRVAGYTDE